MPGLTDEEDEPFILFQSPTLSFIASFINI
jgi:hypothetical protein